MNQASQPNRIFIGHGGSPLWRELKDHIKDELHLHPDEFNRVAIAGVATADRLNRLLKNEFECVQATISRVTEPLPRSKKTPVARFERSTSVLGGMRTRISTAC